MEQQEAVIKAEEHLKKYGIDLSLYKMHDEVIEFHQDGSKLVSFWLRTGGCGFTVLVKKDSECHAEFV